MLTLFLVAVGLFILWGGLRLWLTANRLDRLHIRTQAAWLALEAALARRIAIVRTLALLETMDTVASKELLAAAATADTAPVAQRARVESHFSNVIEQHLPFEQGKLHDEWADTVARVTLATQFYNDAVRDTRALRASWFTRLFRLAGHAPLPDYFPQPREEK